MKRSARHCHRMRTSNDSATETSESETLVTVNALTKTSVHPETVGMEWGDCGAIRATLRNWPSHALRIEIGWLLQHRKSACLRQGDWECSRTYVVGFRSWG